MTLKDNSFEFIRKKKIFELTDFLRFAILNNWWTALLLFVN